jgi:hypothetical protein
LSKSEIAMDNSYQDDTDPSVYVKFRLKEAAELGSQSLDLGEAEATTSSSDQDSEYDPVDSKIQDLVSTIYC